MLHPRVGALPVFLAVSVILPLLGSAAAPARSAQEAGAVDEARKLLAEAGFPGGKGFPRTAILYNTHVSHKKIAAVVSQMWKNRLGIEVSLEVAEWKTYLDRLSSVDYQIARRGWISDYPDPSSFLDLMQSESGNNNTGWRHGPYDDLLARAEREPSRSKRMGLLYQAEENLLEEAPVLPIYGYVSHSLYNERKIVGLYPNSQDAHPLTQVLKGNGRSVLMLDNQAEVRSLDPGTSMSFSERNVQMAIFEGLRSASPRGGLSVPGVATRVEVSEDLKTYTFHLRPCAWTDGRPVTAGDFEYAWKRLLDPQTKSVYAYLLFVLKGGERYHRGKGSRAEVGVRATDDRTLRVELARPVPYFREIAAMFPLLPVRQDLVKRFGTDWTKPENFQGNGPFRLAQWIPNEHILVERNPRYWNANVVKQDRVQFVPLDDRMEAFRLYEAGDLDYLSALPAGLVPELSKRKDFHTSPLMVTYFYSFNTTVPPFDDPRVRRALSLSVDRELLCKQVLRGGQIPTRRLVPSIFREFGYKPSVRREF